MLVLSRKLGETVVIGKNIIVKVLEVKGQRVKLGFIAPEGESVHRGEVVEKIAEHTAKEVKQC